MQPRFGELRVRRALLVEIFANALMVAAAGGGVF